MDYKNKILELKNQNEYFKKEYDMQTNIISDLQEQIKI